MADEDSAVSEAADQLYAVEPDGFVAERDRLAAQARSAGDTATAKRIAALRKPTVAAWIVNRHVLADPGCVDVLVSLHERLAAAQTDLDADTLRQLTSERRDAVQQLTRAALAGADRADAPAALRDEVVATLDAAVADPETAGRLGRLLRAEHWSGFGVAAGDLPPSAPALRLVRGGRDAPAKKADGPAQKKTTAPSRKPAADRAAARQAARAVQSAQRALDAAEQHLTDADGDERAAHDRVQELTDELTRIQEQLDAAKSGYDAARRAAKAARAKRREARSALDRAERQAERAPAPRER